MLCPSLKGTEILPVSESSFRTLREKTAAGQYKYYYVDKSLMIKDLIEKAAFSGLITRPRRFGKSMNMTKL